MAGYSDVKSTFISDVVAADDNGYSVSAAVANNAALVLGGALADGGSVTNSSGRITEITSGGDDSGISFTVVGTDVTGTALTESITGADTGAATGSKFFKTITSITAVGDPVGTVIAGITAGAADVVFAGPTRLKGANIVNDAAAGTVEFLNTSDGSAISSGTSILTVGTVASATVIRDMTIPDEGLHFKDGCFVKFDVGKCESITTFQA
tara:strand:+ start:95 stop:724 length:630 start_codon:yes stop_codon:yes gene_type:complete